MRDPRIDPVLVSENGRKPMPQTDKQTGFNAKFSSGATTTDHKIACFFQIMQDKQATTEDIQSYIDIGRITDRFQNWTEIQRIADSLAQGVMPTDKHVKQTQMLAGKPVSRVDIQKEKA